MEKLARVCPRCGEVKPGGQPCPRCYPRARTQADQRRGTAKERGYGRQHRRKFRPGVLERDKVCTCIDATCPNHKGRCLHLSTVADHHPLTRRELVQQGLDPDDPQYGRGLCKPCHDHATATDERTKGGWNKG